MFFFEIPHVQKKLFFWFCFFIFVFLIPFPTFNFFFVFLGGFLTYAMFKKSCRFFGPHFNLFCFFCVSRNGMFWFQKMLGNMCFSDFWVELEDSKPGFVEGMCLFSRGSPVSFFFSASHCAHIYP